MADVIITPASGLIDFQNTVGISSASIQLDGNGNLIIGAAAGDIQIGDTSSDIYVGDGVNNVDIVFELDGEIRGLTGKTITLGQSDSFIAFAGDVTGDVDFTGGLNVTGVSTFQSHLHLGDDDELRLGDGSELKIEHRTNGDSTITESGSGALYLGGSTIIIADGYTSDLMARFNDGGSVDLYHNHNKKFETTSGGVSVTGDVSLTSELNFSGPANKYVDFYTKDSGGTAYSATLRLVNHDSTSFNFAVNMIRDGAVELYHSGTKKFETASGGVTVTGTVTADGLNLGDTEYLNLGASNDVQFFHNSSDNTNRLGSYASGDFLFGINNSLTITNQLFSSNTASAKFTNGGSVELYYNNSKKFETISTGATVTGNMYATAYYGDGANLQNVGGTPGGTEGAVQYNSSSALAGIATLMSIDSTNFNVGIGTRIDIVPYDTQDNGTLSFEGSAGQLFSITNSLTSGSIFSVNDVSGIPSIDVDADGTIQLAPFGATEYVGIGTTNPSEKLHVNGGNIAVTDGAIITDQNIDANITIPSGKNGLLIGPTTVGVGVTIDVASGSTLVVV